MIENDFYAYQNEKEYVYNYKTTTKLNKNDIESSLNDVVMTAKVVVQKASPCSYQLNLFKVEFSGNASINDLQRAAEKLTKSAVFFKIGSNGELSPDINLQNREELWVLNIKRSIISAFQLRSENDLNPKDQSIYETDLFGKRRTTYDYKRFYDGSINVNKQKDISVIISLNCSYLS